MRSDREVYDTDRAKPVLEWIGEAQDAANKARVLAPFSPALEMWTEQVRQLRC